MSTQTKLQQSDKLKDYLFELDSKGQKADGTDTFIEHKGSYLSGMPYLWSSDVNRAFIFRDNKQAARVIKKFASILDGAEVIQRRPVCREQR